MQTKIEPSLIDSFVSALNEVPQTNAHLQDSQIRLGGSGQADFLVEVNVAGARWTLVVEAKQTAFPRDAREAVWQLRNYLNHSQLHGHSPAIPFVIAEALSPGARDALRTEGIGYYDKGGSLFMPTQGSFIYIDKLAPKNKARALGAIFKGRKAQVLQTVFALREEWANVKEIASRSEVSPATVSQTLTELERRDWMEARGNGPAKERRLSNPRALVDAWSQYIATTPPTRIRRYYVSAQGSEELVRRLSRACSQAGALYAITGESAAQAYAPFLTHVSQVRCRMLTSEAEQQALSDLEAHSVNDGWNLAVIESHSRGDFGETERMEGAVYASPLQVYLDLQQSPGRGKEAADHLRHVRLGG